MAQTGLDNYFKVSERGSTVSTEVRAGVTTFLVMAYILFVNADILGATGLDPVAVAAGTALVAGILSIAMGVIANHPIALAAGLGINAAVAFGLVLTDGLTAEGAMGVILWEGILVTILVVLGLREAVMAAIPDSLKYSIGVGIGLFILFIGLVNGGLVRQGGAIVEFVFPNSYAAGTTLVGVLIALVLMARKVKGAMIITIVLTTIVALILNVIDLPSNLSASVSFSTIGAVDMGNVFAEMGALAAILTIFTFMLTDFFDTMGTATAVSEQAGLTKDGKIPKLRELLLVDSLGAALGGLCGVSSNTSYIESSAGVAEGGRTGLTSVVTGVLFLIAIILSPLALLVPSQATAPVLILIGFLMVGLLKHIDFTDLEEGLPALLAVILMPLTYSITVGIAAGFLTHTLIKIVKGKAAQVHVLMWIVSAACLIYFLQDWLGAYL
ncbi:MAG: NCS2 family permease [bacterium]|nr:NCS2 family permease [bacterium]MDE0351132.1 NCS2 family permease [bacterium]